MTEVCPFFSSVYSGSCAACGLITTLLRCLSVSMLYGSSPVTITSGGLADWRLPGLEVRSREGLAPCWPLLLAGRLGSWPRFQGSNSCTWTGASLWGSADWLLLLLRSLLLSGG